MKHRIELYRRILRFLYEVLFSVLLMEFFMIIFVRERPGIFAVLIVVSLYLISYVSREKCPNSLALLLVHAVPMVVLAFLPVSIGLFAVSLATDIYLFDEAFLYARRNGVLMPVTDLPWATFFISFIIYLYGYFTKTDIIVDSAYFIPVILIFIYLCSLYLDGLKGYLEATRDVSGLPLQRIITVNTIIVGVVLLLLLGVTVLCRSIDFRALFLGIGQGFVAVIRIMWLVLSFFGGIISSMITTGRSNLAVHSEHYGQEIGAEAGRLGSMMETVLVVVLLVLVLYVLCRLSVRIFKLLIKKHSYDGDMIETVTPVRKNILREKIPGRRLRRLSGEEKIRKMYRSYILRYRYDITLHAGKTTEMIETELSDRQIADVSELTDIYREVRYGGADADRQMIKKMKRLTNIFRRGTTNT